MSKESLQYGNISLFLIMIISFIILGIVILFYLERTEYKNPNYDEVRSTIKEKISHESSEGKTTATFFIGVRDSSWTTLDIDIPISEDKTTFATSIINEMLNSNCMAIPVGTKLRSLFWTEDGIMYIDLTEEFTLNHPLGTWAEMTSIYSLVNTIIYNIKEVKFVKILIEGKEINDIAGHINTLYPLGFKKEI